MKSAYLVASVFALGLTMFSAVPESLADNPIIQTKFTADPAPLVHDGKVYLYTSHDEDSATGFTMYNWLLYSSTDMVNWTDHGIIGGVADPYKTFKWADGNNAWAPQVIERNGKFYLYCPFPKGGHMVIGVAVASDPAGPFVDAIGAPLINRASTSTDIDPTVFLDTDGQAYLYWGHQPKLSYVKLNSDMISYSGGLVDVTMPQTFEEGPWFYHRNDDYYLAFASTCCPEGIGYAMSTSPTGPWTYRGSIMDPTSVSSGNHPGIVDFMGTSYVFGFNYALNAALTTTHRERRSVCVEKLAYNPDGTIPKLPFWSTTGAPQIGHLNPYIRTEAETIAWSQGLKTEVSSEGGMDVTAIESGDFIKVKGVDFGTGATSFAARVASSASGGTIEVRLESQTGTRVATCTVTGTGGAQTWTTKNCPVSGLSGVHDLYFVFVGGTGSLFNFDWWQFTPEDAAAGGSGGGAGSNAGGAGGNGGAASGTGGAASGNAGLGSGAGGSSIGGGSVSATAGAATSGSGAANGGAGSGGGAASAGLSSGSGATSNAGGAVGSSIAGGQSSGCACDVGRSSGSVGGLLTALACLATCTRRRRRSR